MKPRYQKKSTVRRNKHARKPATKRVSLAAPSNNGQAKAMATPTIVFSETQAQHLTYDEAMGMILPEKQIQCCITGQSGTQLNGVMKSHDEIAMAIRSHGAQLSGPTAQGSGFGVCYKDPNHGWVFVRTILNPPFASRQTPDFSHERKG